MVHGQIRWCVCVCVCVCVCAREAADHADSSPLRSWHTPVVCSPRALADRPSCAADFQHHAAMNCAADLRGRPYKRLFITIYNSLVPLVSFNNAASSHATCRPLPSYIVALCISPPRGATLQREPLITLSCCLSMDTAAACCLLLPAAGTALLRYCPGVCYVVVAAAAAVATAPPLFVFLMLLLVTGCCCCHCLPECGC